jgi:hypothetical protein
LKLQKQGKINSKITYEFKSVVYSNAHQFSVATLSDTILVFRTVSNIKDSSYIIIGRVKEFLPSYYFADDLLIIKNTPENQTLLEPFSRPSGELLESLINVEKYWIILKDNLYKIKPAKVLKQKAKIK